IHYKTLDLAFLRLSLDYISFQPNKEERSNQEYKIPILSHKIIVYTFVSIYKKMKSDKRKAGHLPLEMTRLPDFIEIILRQTLLQPNVCQSPNVQYLPHRLHRTILKCDVLHTPLLLAPLRTTVQN